MFTPLRREDVAFRFTFHPPIPETKEAAKAVDAAIEVVEVHVVDAADWLSGKTHNPSRSPGGYAGGAYGGAHRVCDVLVRDAALAVFDNAPDGPDRTAALRSLWLARGAFHRALGCHEAVYARPGASGKITGTEVDEHIRLSTLGVSGVLSCLAHLQDARTQGIGAIVLAAHASQKP